MSREVSRTTVVLWGLGAATFVVAVYVFLDWQDVVL